MNQIIAVHAEGTMPRVMELDLSSLDPVQAHAFKHLPRTGSGVPALRGLSKKEGEVVFKFKVPPSQFSAHCLPDLGKTHEVNVMDDLVLEAGAFY